MEVVSCNIMLLRIRVNLYQYINKFRQVCNYVYILMRIKFVPDENKIMSGVIEIISGRKFNFS